MKRFLNLRRALLLAGASAFAISAVAASGTGKTPPRPDEAELVASGFKVLVATTPAQADWVKGLPPGKIRSMQRNGKKFVIYPDAARKQIYIGGPQEYEAYQQRLPEGQRGAQEAADKAQQAANRASYHKQNDAMTKASAREMSDPFFGASWSDLGW